ncbi:MAG: YdcF family protein [Lachnospiraceae bacterium]|nr:YdcF family protein [Lachnospiraceae bacterium]
MTLILFFISLAVLAAILVTDRRTVYSGFFLLFTAFLFGAFMLDKALNYPDWFSRHFAAHIILDILLLFIFIMLIAYPLVLVPVFLLGGAVLMKKEGFKPRNILSLLFAAGLFAVDMIIPFIFDIGSPGSYMVIYRYLTMVILYLVMQLASFWASDLINLIHFKKNAGLKYVVVLGAGLSGDKPTPLLKSRIDKGISVYRNNPGCRLIFSGGQGADEVITESGAMAAYAIENGVSEDDIIMENRSVNTEENIRFSSLLMEDKKDRFAIVTSSYHLMRALLIAKRLKLNCNGYGASTKLYFSLNAFLREYAGYFRDTRKKRILHLAILTLVFILFSVTGPR